MKNKKPVVVTHNGSFHADDVFAVAVLSIFFNDKIILKRTREEGVIERGDFAVDVGGFYEERNNRFDHHQEGGAGKRTNGIPYAAFGLVWKKYGSKICGNKEVAEYLDRRIVQFIDAEDNGFETFKIKKDVIPYSISSLISSLNPTWDSKISADSEFKRAVKLAKLVLNTEIEKTKSLIKAEKFLSAAYKRADDKRVVVLSRYYPWREFFVKKIKTKFIVYPDKNNWCVVAVNKGRSGFASRKSFPRPWAGKRGGELEKTSGISGAKFCHNKLFFAVADNQLSAVKMAQKALRT